MKQRQAEQHAAHCGPFKGFRVCYCRERCCRSAPDRHGNTTCVCTLCKNPGCPVHDPRRTP